MTVTMKDGLKFCVNCKHCGNFYKCDHPAFAPKPFVDVVTGERYPGMTPPCDVMRKSKCGEEAKYFEAKNWTEEQDND